MCHRCLTAMPMKGGHFFPAVAHKLLAFVAYYLQYAVGLIPTVSGLHMCTMRMLTKLVWSETSKSKSSEWKCPTPPKEMKKSSLFFLLTEVRGQIWFDLNFIRVRCQLRSTWPVSKPIQMRRSLLVKRRAYIEWLRSIPLSMGWTWLVCILMKQKWAVFAFLTFAIYRTKNPHFWTKFMVFYCAMHFSAKRGIAIACRLSVCLSVRLSVRPSVRLWRWWIVIT